MAAHDDLFAPDRRRPRVGVSDLRTAHAPRPAVSWWTVAEDGATFQRAARDAAQRMAQRSVGIRIPDRVDLRKR